jgi:ubiquinone/menaquinone biosynthesis C-methylase UbiE
MQRIDAPEILDFDACSPADVEISMQDIGRVNRWFGGVDTTQKMVERVARVRRLNRLSMLEVAAGSGEVAGIVRRRLARRGIVLDLTLLDRAPSHLLASRGIRDDARKNRGPRERPAEDRVGETLAVVADALALPFGDGVFDLVSCNLFAHHLGEERLAGFVREALRVSRQAVLINDLIRHPLHLALAFAGFPIMRSRIAWLDGLTSVRRAYVPEEIRSMFTSAFSASPSPTGVELEITRHYLFRMGVIAWKQAA